MSSPGGRQTARNAMTGGREAARSAVSALGRRIGGLAGGLAGRGPWRVGGLASGLAGRGPWRVVVEETSMVPALEPGDWLLVDPTVRSWPRRGSVVVVIEPDSDLLVIKRVAGRPGDEVATSGGFVRLGPREAWLRGDADGSHDSRHYGPVPLDRLVARAWFRYGPLGRVGRIARPGAP